MAVTYQDRPPQLQVLFGSLNRPLSSFNLVEAETITTVNAVPVANLTFESLAPEGKVSPAENSDLALCRPGTEMILRAGANRRLFAGIVTNQSFRVVEGRTRLKIELQHPLCRPRDKIRSRVFTNVRDGELVSRILAEHKLRARGTQWLTISNRQMVQSAITDWAMIAARTLANAMWLAATDDGAEILQPKLAAAPDRIVSQDDLLSEDSPIVSIDWGFNVQTKRIEVSAWNIQQQTMTKAKRGTQPRIGRGALDPDRLGSIATSSSAELSSAVTLSPAELSGWADMRMLAMRAAGVRTELCLAGTTDFRLGNTLRLDGFGSNLDGDGLVSAVRQSFVQGRWRTYVRTGQPPANIDADLVPGDARMTIGIVDRLKRDPDGWYRIEVTLPTFENSPSIWARLMLPYASTNAGFFFYPEKGDEAAVEFMDGDPRMPVVTGFFSNPRRKPAIAPHEDQGEKGIFVQRTTGQQRLSFSSRDNQVELHNAKSSVTMTDGVDIKARTQLAAAGQAVKISGQSTEMEGKRVLIKGKKIDMM